jgi:hypothetical protein
MITLPSSSHKAPKMINKPPKADLRREITAWRVLVWAYRDECVRAATNSLEAGRLAETGYAASRYGAGPGSGGAINGLLEAHMDAHMIDQLVANWFDEWPMWRQGVAVYAESGKYPPRAEDLPRLRIVGPQLKPNGRHVELWRDAGAKDHPYLCPLEIDGFEADAIERHRQFVILFEALLDVLQGLPLTKWKIVGRGH